MSNIKNMSYYDRPREKASLQGLENLSNAELLAILISTGTKQYSAIDIANELLSKFNGINGIIKAQISELMEIKGISVAKALRIHCGLYLYERALLEERFNKLRLNNVQSIGKYFIAKIGKSLQEIGYVVIVDKNDKVIKINELFKGTISRLDGSHQLLFRQVMGEGKRFYFVHNHPSGILIPSDNDLKFTSNLDMISITLGLELVDHLIVNDNDYISVIKYMIDNM